MTESTRRNFLKSSAVAAASTAIAAPAIAKNRAGANDLGGTLMNESISRAAGADHGQELAPEKMDRLAESLGRTPKQRTTLYGDPAEDRIAISYRAAPLTAVRNKHAREFKVAS